MGICKGENCKRETRSVGSSYCETHYYRLRRGSVKGLSEILTDCIYCGDCLPKGREKYCSNRCCVRSARGAPKTRNCVVCGELCDTTKNNTVCSDECLKVRRHKAAHLSKKKSRTTMEGRCKSNDYGYISRAKKHGVEWEKISSYTVFVEQKFICQICGEPTDPKAVWPDKNFTSLDHIIPMSGGGKHIRKNVQTSHLGCNLRKAHRYDKAFTAKAKRMAGETGQYARRKRNGPKLKSNNKLQSRGFDKTLTKGFDGKVRKR